MEVSIIITAASVVTAITTLIATSGKWGRFLAIKIGRIAVNHIRFEDIDPESMAGKSIRYKEDIASSLESISSTMTEMQKEITKNRVDNLRIELLQLIHNTPQKVEVIERVYQSYIESGGNSYVSQVMEEWRLIYAKKAIRDTIGK